MFHIIKPLHFIFFTENCFTTCMFNHKIIWWSTKCACRQKYRMATGSWRGAAGLLGNHHGIGRGTNVGPISHTSTETSPLRGTNSEVHVQHASSLPPRESDFRSGILRLLYLAYDLICNGQEEDRINCECHPTSLNLSLTSLFPFAVPDIAWGLLCK